MSLLDFLGGGLNAATAAATGQQEGQEKGSALMRQIMMQQAQMDKENAETDFTRHKNLAPVLGERGYDTAHGQVAGAEAAARSPYTISDAVGIAQGTAPIKVKEAVDTARQIEPIHTQGAINTAAGVAPIHTREAINTAYGTVAPHIQQAVGEAQGTLGTKKDLATFEGGLRDQNAADAESRTEANKRGEENYKEGAGVIAPLMRKITGNPIQPMNPGDAPSAQKVIRNPAQKGPTAAQIQRAASDPVYAAYLKSKGGK